MQAVILAAGQSSRFYPFNKSLPHKSFFTLLGRPIIEHTLLSLKQSGITDVILVTSSDPSIKNYLGSGEKLGVNITYCIQKEPNGQGDALLSVADKLESHFFLLHSHRADVSEFKADMERTYDGKNVVLLAKEETDMSRYGALKVSKDRVLDIVEKPKKGEEPSHLRIIGIYLLNKDFVSVLSGTLAGHYSLETALSSFAKQGRVRFIATKKDSYSLKYPWDVLNIKNYLLASLPSYISKKATVAKSAQIEGNVFIDDGAVIMERSSIKGPCYIGKNVVIGTHTLIRGGSSIEKGAKIGAYTEVKNSLIGSNSSFHSGFVGDCVIGEDCKVGGLFCAANRRIDRKEIMVEINGKDVETHVRFLGVIMGDGVKVGIRVSTMPGVVIGNRSIIGPSTTVVRNVDQDTVYYTEFKEVIEKRSMNVTKVDKKEKIVLFDIDYTLFDTVTFKQSSLQIYKAYQEVLDVLVELGQIAKLGIFSEGDKDFQSKKLRDSDIEKYFISEHVHIVPRKEETMKEVLVKYEHNQLFVVDDKLPFLHMVQHYAPHVFTIWVKRGIYAENQKPIRGFKPYATVKNLKSILPIIART